LEVIIFSSNRERSEELSGITGDLMAEEKLKRMSLNTNLPSTIASLIRCFNRKCGYLVILFTPGYSKWRELISGISNEHRRVKFLIVSQNPSDAADLFNSESKESICGYIKYEEESFIEILKKELNRIYISVTTLCGGIMTPTKEVGGFKVIRYDDIYCIETIKNTHLCRIHHTNGSDELRADISKLIKKLPPNFEVTKASTIANLSRVIEVQKQDNGTGELSFGLGLSCFASAKHFPKVKKMMAEQALT